jgi:glucose-1-phosphate thymidylyltransferase
MKGIVLAGGTGSRLWPLTLAVSKQLLPVFDKPLIYYPIATLFTAGVRDILFITTSQDQQAFMNLLGDGSKFGAKFSYAIQPQPEGIAQAFIIGKNFIGSDNVAMILGDNIFHGVNLSSQMKSSTGLQGATIFAHKVKDPERYGVVEFDNEGQVTGVIEKPINPKSNYAVPGLYFYDSQVVDFAEQISPSKRGELEITEVNNLYIKQNQMTVVKLEKGTTWLDAGTFESLHDASTYIKILEERQGKKIGCLEEIAFENKWINTSEIEESIKIYKNNSYGAYLEQLLEG